MKNQYYVVGSGIVGCVIAHELALKGNAVRVFEKRRHTGGNLFDYTDKYGIRVQAYGPHIFHTSNEKIWEYVNCFCEFKPYRLVCGSEIDGKCVPVSFDFTAIDTFFPDEAETIKAHIISAFPGRTKATVLELLDSGDPYVQKFSRFLYEKDYAPYTAKQWGVKPEEIDRSIFRRVPVLLSYGSRYFDDQYQGMPADGYATLINRLLDHENISVQTNVDALEHLEIKGGNVWIDGMKADGTVFYTGRIDALFGFRYGVLPYRSLRFEWKHEAVDSFQKYPVVAYPQAEGYTRITEYKMLPSQQVPGTTYAVEYPLPVPQGAVNEPFYPVITEESLALFERYLKSASRTKGLICCGRLADFKYYNMDQAIERALQIVEGL